MFYNIIYIIFYQIYKFGYTEKSPDLIWTFYHLIHIKISMSVSENVSFIISLTFSHFSLSNPQPINGIAIFLTLLFNANIFIAFNEFFN